MRGRNKASAALKRHNDCVSQRLFFGPLDNSMMHLESMEGRKGTPGTHLGLPLNTSESTFYWTNRGRMMGLVKWTCIVFLGLLPLAFLLERIVDDFLNNDNLLGIVDIFIATPTLIFFVEYSKTYVSSDSPSDNS